GIELEEDCLILPEDPITDLGDFAVEVKLAIHLYDENDDDDDDYNVDEDDDNVEDNDNDYKI
ncbi:hypothetical protein PoB_005951100, partial [Plakobranchus ocellatus]